MELQQIKTLLIDGDGVLWRGNQPIDGLNDFIKTLDQHNINWALLTNNSSRTVDMYVDKFKKFGIDLPEERIFSSATVTLAYMQKQYAQGAVVYVMGMPPLSDTLRRGGFNVYDGSNNPEQADVVVVGIDRDINYERLTIAGRLIMGGSDFVATNPDTSFPAPDGIYPGAGTMIAALEVMTEKSPVIMGKPFPTMFKTAMNAVGAEVQSTAMIGDRVETDIQGAKELGLGTILVMTGVTDEARLAKSTIEPDHIFPSIKELGEAIR